MRKRISVQAGANRKPHIAHVITRLDKGGSATNTIVSADRQRDAGFDTTLIYGPTHDPDGTIQKMLDARGINAMYLPCLKRNVAPIADLRALVAFIRIFRSGRFDLIHTHTSKAGLLGRAAAALCRIPCVHTPHGHIFYGYFGSCMTRAFVWLERLAAIKTQRIISLTDRETEESLERGIGRPEQFVTIPSGVPLAGFRQAPASAGIAFRQHFQIPPEAVVAVSVGRLTPIKGCDILINAFAALAQRLPEIDSRLVMVGDGEMRDALTAQARERGVAGRIVFTGEMEDVSGPLKAADYFVLASRNEGMGRAFIEAMASGLPVIGTNTGGVGTIIRDGETGLLVENENETALTDAMERLAQDKPFRQNAGQKAIQFVDPTFSEDVMVDRLCALYREVLAEQLVS